MQRYLYLVLDNAHNVAKLGVSNNPERRLKDIQTGYPYQLTLAIAILCKNPFKVESALHKKFADCKLKGEWFTYSSLTKLTLQDIIDLDNSF